MTPADTAHQVDPVPVPTAHQVDVARPEADAARVEAARLREALECYTDDTYRNVIVWRATADGYDDLAQAALAAPSPSPSARDLALLRLGEAALAYEAARGTLDGPTAKAAYLVALGEARREGTP